MTFGGYTRSTPEPSALPLRVTVVGKIVAGLMQRVQKKQNIVKADLQNSTASQDDCSWGGSITNSPNGRRSP